MRVKTETDFADYSNEVVSKALFGRIERLVKDKKLREIMGRRNIELIKTGKFSMEKRVKQLGELFSSALGGR